MANAALGSKRVCVSCAVRFYDLTRAPAICPKCGAEQPIEVPRPSRPARGMMADRRFKRAAPAPVVPELENEPAGAEDAEEDEDAEEADDPAEDETILIDDEEDDGKERLTPE